MTDRGERAPQMSVKEFEEIAAAAPETVTLEFIGGRLEVKKAADGDRGTVLCRLRRHCLQVAPELDLYQGRGLRVEERREGRARPDAVLAPRGHFTGHGEWAEPAGVLMVVEVTAYDPDTDRLNRQGKPTAYGESEIPLYLLIDRDARTVTVHSNPDRHVGGYRDVHTAKFGEKVLVPGPMDIELDTEILKNYVR
ncbi:Uma2 family endonuclease [Streptomyces sp. CMSTAAHL-2]|uniref:Uma2 family endonuclease n=1 Tax=Streptomyces sp. CMSTAAHL-2 TaxID=2904522 RepID=UPI001E58C3E3|nr:Uma2 family endonuclease [Streptomyces sp. CMSTAAHL-2]MCE3033034.1 Uma2 family endonuclease [Streptomyces sp. CMSTAAHL-2]